MTQDICISDLSVLLVEPSSSQRKLIRRFLEQAGLTKVDEAGGLEEAMELLARHPADLVLSALYLPDGTNVDLITRMRSAQPPVGSPVMLLSSEDKWHNLDPARQAGIVAILGKPFTAGDLKAALYSALDYLQPVELTLENYDSEELRVLVVDDSSMARKHLSRVLSDMGVRHITTANDGVAAVALMEQQVFDLVVTDYNMPEMDGQQLTAHIRSSTGHAHVPILMVTSEQEGSRLNSVRQSGVSAICDKPFEPSNVRALLQRIMNG